MNEEKSHMKHPLKKLIRTAFLVLPVLFLPFLSSRADGWIEEDGSWKYRYDDGSFETGGWKWIDGNRDCVAECYYFNEDGTIVCDSETPDGYTVDDTGAWILDGEVQTHPAEVSFAVTGDNLIHKELIAFGQALGNYDFLYDWTLEQELKNADLAVLSQETIYVDRQELCSGFPTFGTPLSVGESALKAGFNLAACATNHTMDKGMAGIDTTAAFYEANHIPYLGIQPSSRREYEPFRLLTVNGVRLALFDYSYGTNGIRIPAAYPNAVHLLNDPARIREDLALGREAADALIVFVHWGEEYQPDPNAFQLSFAELFLECGVDVVVGTHPHVLQPMQVMEREDGHRMLIYYSLGNMVSRQDRPESSIGGLAAFTISRTPEGCTFRDPELLPVIAHQSATWSQAGMLDRYTAEQAASHRMHLSLDQWRSLFLQWTKGTGTFREATTSEEGEE